MSEILNTIEQIRSESRALVRALGFMGGDFAGTRFSPSAVHAMIEVQANPGISARELSLALRLEKSSISRALRKLIEAGLIEERPSESDSRSKMLLLTPSGEQQVNDIHTFARTQVERALINLRPGEDKIVLRGLHLYARALYRLQEEPAQPLSIRVVEGYQPGLIARITEMFALYHSRTRWEGEQQKEVAIACELAHFFADESACCRRIWVAMYDDRIVGSLIIHVRQDGPSAELRWFIVEETLRGQGVGRKLLDSALNFIDGCQIKQTSVNLEHPDENALLLLRRAGFLSVTTESLNQGEPRQYLRLSPNR